MITRTLLLLVVFGRLSGQPPAGVLPEFRFSTMDGRVFTNADLPKGKLLLFVFVDPDCDHCQRAVQKMDEQYGSFGKVAMYFVAAADPGKINVFAKRYAPRLKGLWLRDADNQFIVRFRPVRYPSLFLYSTDKKLLDYEDNEETIFRIVRSIGGHAG
jgi:hypothetical protein